MIRSERWNDMSNDERSTALRDEIKAVESNTRLLKKMIVTLAARVGDIRRHFGMRKGEGAR